MTFPVDRQLTSTGNTFPLLELRYMDPDGTATNAQVKADFYKQDRRLDSYSLVCSADSNTSSATTLNQVHCLPSTDFTPADMRKYYFWVYM